MTRDDGTTEHKPMTDAELARLERAYSAENWADSDGPVEARNARALIAEVRRLREEIAYLTRGHDWANAMRVVVDSGTLDADQLERLREHFEKWLRDPEPFYVVRLGDRTLTLPNGTVVRSGDVLVNTHYPFGTGCLRRSVVLVTAVGENTFLGREIAATVGVIKVDVPDEINPGEHDWNPLLGYREGKNDTGWRQWSEVYPDRPVPGGGER